MSVLSDPLPVDYGDLVFSLAPPILPDLAPATASMVLAPLDLSHVIGLLIYAGLLARGLPRMHQRRLRS